MRSVSPSLQNRRPKGRRVASRVRGRGAWDEPRGSGPLAVGELLGLALPRRLQQRILDLDLVRRVWESAVSPEFADLAARAHPSSFEGGVLVVQTDTSEAAREVKRSRKVICERLLRAAGLPDAKLRLRILEPEDTSKRTTT